MLLANSPTSSIRNIKGCLARTDYLAPLLLPWPCALVDVVVAFEFAFAFAAANRSGAAM